MLIMDESLANVDEAAKQQIILAVKIRFPEKLFVYISHNVAEVARFCKEIIVIRPPGKQPRMQTVYGLDDYGPAKPDPRRLEPVMLDIMNAL